MDIKINYQGMDDNTANAFKSIQAYTQELERRLSNDKKSSNINGNDIHKLNNRYFTENVMVSANSNNPPTIKAGTTFLNEKYEYVYETADVTFSWGAGGLPSISNSTTYYLYLVSVTDGRGTYNVSTTAPARSDLYNGWYITGLGKAICRFRVDSGGNVLPGSICNMGEKLVAELYTTSTSNPSITGLNLEKHGSTYIIKADFYINAASAAPYLLWYSNGAGATNTNWHSIIQYNANVAGLAANDNYIYHSPSTYTAQHHQCDMLVHLINGQPYYISRCMNNMESTYNYSYCAGSLKASLGALNITQMDFAMFGAAWSAGSDIRIYRR